MTALEPSAPDRWKRAREVFDAVVDLPPSERDLQLDMRCAGDPDLRDEVASLLAHDRSPHDTLHRIVIDAAAEAAEEAGGVGEAGEAGEAGWHDVEEAAAPRELGHYRILDRLGEGGMGEVWIAEDTTLGRRVALKVPRAHLARDPDARQRLQREARAAATLNHPNVCVIHEVGDGPDGRPYIAMELIDGDTLTTRIQRGPLKVADVLTLGRQAASALQAAHALGVVHRDLKPSNIMFTGHGIKLLDFGLASVARDAAAGLSGLPAAGFMGTVPYMSPEQVRAEAVDHRTDLFSLGAVLYEAATGRLPFDAPSERETCAAILTREPVPPTQWTPHLPAALERVIMRALAKPLDARYQSAAELGNELAAIDRRSEVRSPAAAPASPASSASSASSGSSASSTSSASSASSASSLPSSLTSSATSESVALRDATHGAAIGHAMGTRWLWLAAALISIVVAVVTAAVAWQARGQAPMADGSTLERPGDLSLLLADFTNATGDSAFDGTLRQALLVQLQQTPFLRVLPRAGVQETLRRMTRPPDTRLTGEIAQEIARRRGIQAWISGSIASTDRGYRVSLVATRGDSGELLAREDALARSRIDVLPALGAASTRLRARLGESIQSIGQFNAPIQQATTPSLDALKAYTLGTQQSEQGDYAVAVSLFERAVQLDPEFAMAYQALARDQANIVHSPQAIALSGTRAYQLRTRATEQERFSIELGYHAHVTGALERAVASAERWRATYPRDFRPHHQLADLYFTLGQHERAAEAGRQAVLVNPDVAAAYSNLGASLFALGRFDESREVYRQAMARGLDAPEYHAFLWRIAYYTNDAEGMRRQTDWAAASASWAHNMPALIAGLQGRWTDARAQSRDASAFFARRNMPGLVVMAARYETLTGALVGDCVTARQSARRVLGDDRFGHEHARVVFALALCGDTAPAASYVERLRRAHPEDTELTKVWLPMIAAAVALQRGRGVEALDALKVTAPYERSGDSWPLYLRGLALLRSGDAAGAQDEFAKLADHPERSFWFPLGPLSRLGLARARAMAGDHAGARRDYEGMFAAWKDADADLPVLIEARAEYARLP